MQTKQQIEQEIINILSEDEKRMGNVYLDKGLVFGCRIKVKCYQKRFTKEKGSHYEYRGTSVGIATNSTDRVLINGFNNVGVDSELDDNTMSFDMMDYGDKTYIISEIIGTFGLSSILRYVNVRKILISFIGNEIWIPLKAEKMYKLPLKETTNWTLEEMVKAKELILKLKDM